MIKGLLKPADNKGALVKKIKASKFVSKPKESDKKDSALTKIDSGSLAIRPKTSLAPKVSPSSISKVKEPTGKINFDYLNSLLDSLIKNTSNLLKVSKSDHKKEVKDAESARRASQLETKRTREERVEEGKKDKERASGLKIAAPKLPLFDSALEFLKRFAIGTAVMQLLNWFSDPKNAKSFIGFFTNNMEKIILGTIAVMGAMALAPLLPLVGAFGALFSITTSIIGSLIALLLNPFVLPSVGIAIAAFAARQAFYKHAIPKIAPFVHNLINANIQRLYGTGGNAKKGVFITKLRDQYGRIASKDEYNKMTADEKNTAQFLSMYDDELQNRKKINDDLFGAKNSLFKNPSRIQQLQKDLAQSDVKIKMLEDQILVQGIKLLEMQELYETTGVLPETSLSKRLYPSTKQQKFDAPSINPQQVSTNPFNLSSIFGNILNLGSTSTSTPVSSPNQPTSTLIPQSNLPALPPTGVDPVHGPAQMYGASRAGGKRKHAGQDFDAGPNDTFYSRIGGEVIYSDYAGGKYGNVVDVYNADLNHTERIAEGDVNLVKKGDIISPGTPVQRGTNQTGVFHYEIRTGRATASGSFSGTVDPIAFLNGLSSAQIAKAQPAAAATAPAATVSQYTSYEEPKREAALIPISIPQQQQQKQSGGGGGSPVIVHPVDPFRVLNTYYSFQILGFLYKQG